MLSKLVLTIFFYFFILFFFLYFHLLFWNILLLIIFLLIIFLLIIFFLIFFLIRFFLIGFLHIIIFLIRFLLIIIITFTLLTFRIRFWWCIIFRSILIAWVLITSLAFGVSKIILRCISFNSFILNLVLDFYWFILIHDLTFNFYINRLP